MSVETTREVYTRLDAEWKIAVAEYERKTGSKFPCGPGCDDCCRAGDGEMPFIFLPMGEAEAKVLLETLRALPSEIQRLVIQRQLLHYADSCIFLSDEGLCMVYEGRPLWCRIFGLSGMPTCGKIHPFASARWTRAVQGFYEELRIGSDTMVSLREIMDRLMRERR